MNELSLCSKIFFRPELSKNGISLNLRWAGFVALDAKNMPKNVIHKNMPFLFILLFIGPLLTTTVILDSN